jgi:hypothetical protein
VLVAEGLVKFAQGGWAAAPQVPVADFLRWVFTAKVSPHTRRLSDHPGRRRPEPEIHP